MPYRFRYRQSKKKNILIFAQRRGASTLLQQILSIDKHTRVVSEPFDMFRNQSRADKMKRLQLPHKFFSQFISLDEPEREKVINYTKNFLSGAFNELGAYSYANRTVAKILNAHPLIDELTKIFETNTILFLRHPVAQAHSLVRNGWGYTAKAYLADEVFCMNYLSENQYEEAKRVMEEEEALEKAVLSWCLENLYPLKHSHCKKIVLTYEELLINQDEVLNILSNEFQVKNIQTMNKVLKAPSTSVHRSTKETIIQIINQDKVKLLNKWQSKLSNKQLKTIQTIFDLFKITEYSANTIIPNKSLFLCKNSHKLFGNIENDGRSLN